MKKCVGGGDGAIFEPKTLSLYLKKEKEKKKSKKKKKRKKFDRADLNPRPPGLKSTRLNTII